MTALASFGSLFAASFIAATFFPFQSEVVLVGMLALGDLPAWSLVAIASVGNTLGSAVNWVLGRYIAHFGDRSWFPVKEARLERVRAIYLRYGVWSLLLSWTPFIGDPLTVVAGVLRTPFALFVSIVALAKTGRYLFLWAAYEGFIRL